MTKLWHPFRSAVSDGGDASLVRPSNWNDRHDVYPDSQGSLYDPFDSDTSANYSTLGSPDSITMHTGTPGHCVVAETGAGANNVVGPYRSWSPSNGSFVECWMTDWLSSRTVSSYTGLFIGEAGGTGKLSLLGLGRYAADFDDKLVMFQYNSRTSFASDSNITGPFHPPIGFKFVYNSSTSIDSFYSHGGKAWRKISNFNPGYTVGIVGLGGDYQASGVQIVAYYDYLNNG